MSDPTNPVHYKQHPSGIECITITRHFNYNLGSAIAYIWRAEHKGTHIEDLEKAAWHLKDEISRLRALHDTDKNTLTGRAQLDSGQLVYGQLATPSRFGNTQQKNP